MAHRTSTLFKKSIKGLKGKKPPKIRRPSGNRLETDEEYRLRLKVAKAGGEDPSKVIASPPPKKKKRRSYKMSSGEEDLSKPSKRRSAGSQADALEMGRR